MVRISTLISWIFTDKAPEIQLMIWKFAKEGELGVVAILRERREGELEYLRLLPKQSAYRKCITNKEFSSHGKWTLGGKLQRSPVPPYAQVWKTFRDIWVGKIGNRKACFPIAVEEDELILRKKCCGLKRLTTQPAGQLYVLHLTPLGI